MAVFNNAGQNCHARSRILVERSVHEKVVELFAAETAKLVVGDPADEKPVVRPVTKATINWLIVPELSAIRTE
jgi:acyl-CoA reductase-like NAD-dependent aldehyde dehydrogenase